MNHLFHIELRVFFLNLFITQAILYKSVLKYYIFNKVKPNINNLIT